jgi:hypothetical protein
VTGAASRPVGAIGGGPPATVDPAGTLRPAGAAWTVEWWIGADDRWRIPANEVAVRQQAVHNVPVVETVMRVPGGDAYQRVYGISGPGDPVVVEVENRSPAPFVAAFAVRGASRVVAEGAHVAVDGAFVCSWARAPSRWARTVAAPVQLPVVTGRAETGPFPGARDRAGRLEVAFLHPVAHRTTLRMIVTRGRRPPDFPDRDLPDAERVAAGWRRQLDRAMQVQLPDRPLEARLRAARADVLLLGQSRAVTAEVLAALEDWGFDAEAAEAWRRVGVRTRRRAAARPAAGTWAALDRMTDPAALLVAARRILVDDTDPARLVLCADHPPAWRGQALEVREAPLAGGTVSYAVRWHGDRPALLWDAPPGTTVRIPGLDPAWESTAASGDALLAPPGPTSG